MDALISFAISALCFILGCLAADQVTFVLERRRLASFRWSIIWTLALTVVAATLEPWSGWPWLIAGFYLLLFLIAALRGPSRTYRNLSRLSTVDDFIRDDGLELPPIDPRPPRAA